MRRKWDEIVFDSVGMPHLIFRTLSEHFYLIFVLKLFDFKWMRWKWDETSSTVPTIVSLKFSKFCVCFLKITCCMDFFAPAEFFLFFFFFFLNWWSLSFQKKNVWNKNLELNWWLNWWRWNFRRTCKYVSKIVFPIVKFKFLENTMNFFTLFQSLKYLTNPNSSLLLSSKTSY